MLQITFGSWRFSSLPYFPPIPNLLSPAYPTSTLLIRGSAPHILYAEFCKCLGEIGDVWLSSLSFPSLWDPSPYGSKFCSPASQDGQKLCCLLCSPLPRPSGPSVPIHGFLPDSQMSRWLEGKASLEGGSLAPNSIQHLHSLTRDWTLTTGLPGKSPLNSISSKAFK